MSLVGFREAAYIRTNLRQVVHTTLNPHGPGVVRIHMVPPENPFSKNVPFVIILNGQDILPITVSWAILLSAFIKQVNAYAGREVMEEDWDKIVADTLRDVHTVYPAVKDEMFKNDLLTIIDTLTHIARGEKPNVDIGVVPLGEYSRYMAAPHRMDLMISAMTKDGKWHCNQKCLHCYAAGQPLSETPEMTTEEWKKIIKKMRAIGVPQLTFTGGEPTMRGDLVELIEESKWFVTRLNTNGALLTKDLCKRLYEAELDSVQVTFYSADEEVHNRLVGAPNWKKSVEGIKNALEAGLNVSINTPLCALNADYEKTLTFANDLGVHYASCSGLIVAGNARKEDSIATQLDAKTLEDILRRAFEICKERHIEISFTSPGWVDADILRNMGYTSVPSCGACLSNMAIAPDGTVIPCQSWLGGCALGNIKTDDWRKIWNGTECRKIRAHSAEMDCTCPLRTKKEGAC